MHSYTLNQFIRLRPALGIRGAIGYLLQEIRLKYLPARMYSLSTKDALHQLIVRSNSSDIWVFDQIFVQREYSCLDNLTDVDLIVDCGANVGYSAAYLLSKFPKSKIVCIEPDRSNFKVLEQNLKPYGDRATLINAGVWSRETNLRIKETPYRDGREWSFQVEECPSETIDSIPSIDISSILSRSGFDRISVLKIDIEGAEVEVFSGDIDQWLSRVDNIVIELHDDSSFGPSSVYVTNKIMSTSRFTRSTSGELTVFNRMLPHV